MNRQRERETDRQTDRQRQRDRETKERERERERDRETERDRERDRDRQRERDPHFQKSCPDHRCLLALMPPSQTPDIPKTSAFCTNCHVISPQCPV